jgi:hypothetical protein
MTSILRIAIAVVAISVVACGCGSGGAAGDASGHLALQAAVKRGACLPVHPGLAPYRGLLVLVRSDGRRVRVDAGRRGRVQRSLAPGSYRLVPPLPGSTVHLELDGQPVSVRGDHYPLRIGAGETARLAVVILPRRGDCTSSGAGA